MRPYWIFGLFLFAVTLALDLVTKAWVYEQLPYFGETGMAYPYGGVGLFPDLFGIEGSIVHATNTGAAWGVFSDFQLPLILVRIALCLGLLIYLLFFNRRKAYIAPLLFVLAGAVGNILDAFLYGKVVDMFKFVLWGYHYPIFNVADIAITVGIAWLLIASFFPERHDKTSPL